MESEEPYNGEHIGDRLGRQLLQRASEILDSRNDGAAGFFKEGSGMEDLAQLKGHPVEELDRYQRYINLLNWVSGGFASAKTQIMRARLALANLNAYTNDAIIGELFNAYIKLLPRVMMGKSFLKLREEAREAYFTKDGKDVSESAASMLIEAVEFYFTLLDREPWRTNPLDVIKEQYQQEHVTSGEILNKWHQVNHHGYYMRAGAKSEIMTREAFDAFIRKEEEGEIKDIIADFEESGMPGFEAELREQPDASNNITWHECTEVAKDVTKWDAIQVIRKLCDATGLKEVMHEFPDLLSAVFSQVRDDFKIDFVSIPADAWDKPLKTRRELYRSEFCDQRIKADNHYKTVIGGMAAVIVDTWESDELWTSDPPPRVYYQEQSLEGYIDQCGASRLEKLKQAKRDLLDSVYYLKGFNCVLEMIAEIHKAPGFLELEIDLNPLEEAAKNLTGTAELLFKVVKSLPANTPLRIERMRAVKDHFLFTRLDDVCIPQANMRKAAKMVRNLSAFQRINAKEFFPLILIRPTEESKEGGE